MNGVERTCAVVSGEEHVFAHHAFERLSIDARHG